MPEFNQDAFAAGLTQLRQRFQIELPQRLALIDAAWKNCHQHTANAELLDELHRLAGAAGSLGFAQISHLTRELEQTLKHELVPIDSYLQQCLQHNTW
ncbi:Hpt domain-containing protein [Deefgea salmonis]|uniref:Hpt domain-containing protein n=1 Tax=Deefgea salmonis TaxID=2875502 RepID=A0ABS8BP35_9NEIS|nr:Hpt domain-containing protein [Deefgea salmonis]MCB5197339.1 Hpt domain-containing protein [Deefgea salmonis]